MTGFRDSKYASPVQPPLNKEDNIAIICEDAVKIEMTEAMSALVGEWNSKQFMKECLLPIWKQHSPRSHAR